MHDKILARWDAVSLRTKMTGVSVFLLTIGLIVAGFGSMSVLKNYLNDEVDKDITSAAVSRVSVKDIESAEAVCHFQESSTPTEYYVAIFATDGTQLCDNSTAMDDDPVITSLPLAETPKPFNAEGESADWRAVAAARQIPSGDTVIVVVARSLSSSDIVVSQFAAIFLFFGLTVVVLGGALTRLLVTSTFAPLREVEATAARFAAGDFTQRLGAATPNTEVGRLNRSLNSMLSRIDSAFADRARTIEQMRSFVGDASHELRTPLVSVRGYAELYRMGALTDPEAVRQAMERIEKEAIRMGELVADLLELARIDEAKPLNLAEVDLVPLARDAALDAMASSPGRTVTVVVTDTANEDLEEVPDVTASGPEKETAPQATGPIRFAGVSFPRLRNRRPRQLKLEQSTIALPKKAVSSTKAVITAEENKIRQVITNLMGNAMRFTPTDSPIEIGVEVDPARGKAILSVIDHGEGIPPQIREKIFQRFWRADSSRNRDTGGSGLGLAIVASIVAAHHGDIEVVETPGGGATFRVGLPILQQSTGSVPPTVA
jgi:two-component system OmpR family sensor kinase